MARRRQLQRVPVEGGRIVFRFVGTASLDPKELAPWFIPDREDPNLPTDLREQKYPELRDGRSAYCTEDLARQRWDAMYKNALHAGQSSVRQGHFIAEVVLSDGEGFELEDRRKRDGHLTIWGDQLKLAKAVCRVFPAQEQKKG